MKRNFYFDNLKFILIFLVVLGHFIEPLINIRIYKYIYWFIYIFHMPCFIFILGYFSKNIIKDGNLKNNKWLNYILLYIIMQLLLILINGSNLNFVIPGYGLWFLQCVVIWYLLLPVLMRIKPKVCIIICFIVSLLAGYDKQISTDISLSRMLVFLPYFMLGYYTTLDHIKKIKQLKIYWFILFIIALFILKMDFVDTNFLKLFYGKISYISLNLGKLGIIYRLLAYFISVSFSLLFLAIVPNIKFIFTKIGSKTLPIYCLQIILIVIYIKYDLYFDNLFLLSLISLFTVIFLSNKYFSMVFDYFMNLKFKKIFK